jgi:hypothetical protein
MRARTNWQQTGTASITDPCVDVQYGETEDYKVTIVAPTGVGVSELYANVDLQVLDLGEGNFQIKVKGLEEAFNLNIHNSIGQLVMTEKNISANGITTYDFSLASEAKGYYLINVSNNNFSKIQKITYR